MHSAIPKSPPITAHSLNHSCLTSLRLTHQQAEHPQRCIQRTACAHTYGQKYITLLTNLRCSYKELLSRPQPKWLFCVVSHLLCKHTYPLAQRVSSFIILPHNKAQIHVRCYIFFKIFLTALRLHSGESSQNSERA